MEEISAGGVVVNKNSVLVLKKYRGDWVLPKGRLEEGETQEQAALREVHEESGVISSIKKYIGYVKYIYRHNTGESVNKTVHYYLMEIQASELKPQREEGFCEAVFIDYGKALNLLKHDAEKNMVKKAMEFIDSSR